MVASLLKEQKKLVGNVTGNPGGIYFSDWNEESREGADRIAKQFADLAGRGIKPLTVKQKFTRADMLDEYQGPYAICCMHLHNNINILEDRHFSGGGGDIRVCVSNDFSDDDAQMVVGKAADILVSSLAAVAQLAKGVEPAALEPVQRALQELRDTWKQEDAQCGPGSPVFSELSRPPSPSVERRRMWE